jgi:hypothetical protein
MAIEDNRTPRRKGILRRLSPIEGRIACDSIRFNYRFDSKDANERKRSEAKQLDPRIAFLQERSIAKTRKVEKTAESIRATLLFVHPQGAPAPANLPLPINIFLRHFPRFCLLRQLLTPSL